MITGTRSAGTTSTRCYVPRRSASCLLGVHVRAGSWIVTLHGCVWGTIQVTRTSRDNL